MSRSLGLSDITITGDSEVAMGEQYTYTCSAKCVPSCSFTWKFMGNTFQGNQIQIPILRRENKPGFASRLEITVSDHSKTEALTCEATNTASHATITATKNLTVIGESVRLPSTVF